RSLARSERRVSLRLPLAFEQWIQLEPEPEQEEDHLEAVVDVVEIEADYREYANGTSSSEQSGSVHDVGPEVLLVDVHVFDRVEHGENGERVHPRISRISPHQHERQDCDERVEREVRLLAVGCSTDQRRAAKLDHDVLAEVRDLRQEREGK